MQAKKEKQPAKLAFNEIKSDSLQLLLKNISSLNRAVELQAVLNESLEVICNVMKTEASSLMLVDEENGELIVSMPTGPVQKEIKGMRLSEGEGIAGWVLEHGETYFSNDVKEDEKFGGDLSEDFTSRNIICSPLYNKSGAVFGVLQAINRFDNEVFSGQDVRIFETLADHVAISIERTRELEHLQQEIEEKELLLREVHHRIKNNLSTLTALIEMEFTEIDNEHAEHILRKTCSRIESMTEVHDLLHNSGLSYCINLGSYLKRLTGKIEDTLSDPAKKVTIDIDADPIEIDTERAMSCGLVMNELLVNAYKHAFNKMQEGGTIFIKLKQMDNGVVNLMVSDNGSGIGENFSLDDSGSIGSWLINVLLRRLKASVDINQKEGTTFSIKFEK
ncbi:MAG TPA: histidine kinase dimerization/phosphoacceptor domain -containing protein [Balneolaceae bacterium]|nr:histidine kinase dimerization/phosphoacceptor domain -containing protein [Balneolaceae bacterium]